MLEMENEFIIAANKSFENSDKLDRLKRNEGYQKAKKLQSLGFSNAEQSESYNKLEREMKAEEVNINLVKYYRKTYGAFTFILGKDFDAICIKHKFHCGDISSYNGYVSDETISKIQKVPRIKKDDLECFVVEEGRGEAKGLFVTPNFNIGVVPLKKRGALKRNFSYSFLSTVFEGNNKYRTDTDEHGLKNSFLNDGEFFNHTEYSKLHFKNFVKEGLKICGRLNFDSYGELYLNHNLPIPIIVQQVRGGYIIVCTMEKEIANSILKYKRDDLKQFHLVQGDGFNFPGYEGKYIFGELYEAIENEDKEMEKKFKEYIELNSLDLDISKLEKYELDEL